MTTRPSRLRVLYLAPRLPWPADRGARIRSDALIRALSAHHEVTLVALSAPSEAETAPPAELDVEVLTLPHAPLDAPRVLSALRGAVRGVPYAIARYESRALFEQVAARAAHADLVIAGQLHMAQYLDARGPTLIDEHNIESEVWWRLARRAHGPRTLGLATQAALLARFERRACAAATVVTCCSERDRSWIVAAGQQRARVVPNGVDTAQYTPALAAAEDPAHLLFIGSLDWAPNDEGLRRFHAHVWPQLVAARPDLRMSVVGHSPGRALAALGRRGDGFEVVGAVDDVRPWLARATLVVVPLYAGGGTRLKILEAFAAGKAVVSTTLGAEGLDVGDGRELLLADDDAAFGAKILRALGDAGLRARLAATGRALAVARYDWARVAEPWLLAVEEAAAAGRRR